MHPVPPSAVVWGVLLVRFECAPKTSYIEHVVQRRGLWVVILLRGAPFMNWWIIKQTGFAINQALSATIALTHHGCPPSGYSEVQMLQLDTNQMQAPGFRTFQSLEARVR